MYFEKVCSGNWKGLVRKGGSCAISLQKEAEDSGSMDSRESQPMELGDSDGVGNPFEWWIDSWGVRKKKAWVVVRQTQKLLRKEEEKN